MMPPLSTRNWTWPALAFLTAVATSGVTVPTFGFGIKPRGPRIWPSVPTTRMVSGEAITTSKFKLPALICAARSSMPTMSAPAALASSALAPWANTATRLVLPVPLGSTTAPRTTWSDFLASMPSCTATSMDSSNLAVAASLTIASASASGYSLLLSTLPSRAFCFLVSLVIYTPSTVTPIDLAEPARVLTAASMLAAFMSFILVLAISSSWARVILPTLSLCGVLDPLSSLIAFLIKVVAGGVLMMKVKLLSANAVITTGSGSPGSTPWVWALNALQNSMMFRPRWPSAGPIGGDGLALPAGTCSLTKPTIFFAMVYSLRVIAPGHKGRGSPGVNDSPSSAVRGVGARMAM